MRRTTAMIIGAAALALLACGSPSFALDRNALLDEANLVLLPRERPLPSVGLVDEQGEAVTTEP